MNFDQWWDMHETGDEPERDVWESVWEAGYYYGGIDATKENDVEEPTAHTMFYYTFANNKPGR